MVGDWKVTSVEHFTDAGTLYPFGDDPQGFLMYSAEGSDVGGPDGGRSPQPGDGPAARHEHRDRGGTVAALHSAYGFAGTYVVEGSVITHQCW